ncbi:AAA family ATPase [Pseudoxanthomonas mexicana]|uniref:UvrD-helicase domain-containing protein n=1 Tax=Pseudoxanthomonas mexicana TaxID=128785 RepID=UPI001FD6F621|nr:UvrD-helicase domain-containing protein [Pseudoxanthomonas mexicana]UOV04150.1 AAA family ATPase [Pseudoxanthomonas mexicana]
MKSLAALRRRGGPYQKAAEKAIVVQYDLGDDGRRAVLPITNNGESRVKKAVKYDLGANACRLVTVQDGGYIFLCFAGTHDEADEWLDRNRGLSIRVDGQSKPIAMYESIDITEPGNRLQGEMGFTSKPLLSLLDQSLQDALMSGLIWRLAVQIAGAEVHINDDEIEALVDQVSDEDQRSAIFDVLIQLREDDVDGARNRVLAFTGELRTIEEAVEARSDLVDSSDFQYINVDSEHYRRLIEHYSKNADFKDWMLFMHPDQQQFVDANYAGPAKLSGVSGSGKTCVVVRRAIALAEKYPGERVLVLTLNRSLAVLIQTLVDKAAQKNVRDQIEVLPFFKLCQNLLSEFEPDNHRLYDDVTWKSKEHIDEIWREYYRCELNNRDASILQRLHDSLISRGIGAENYVREEYDWIRSAVRPSDRNAYLRMERSGRTYPLDESFRRELLEGLSFWENKMRFVGVTDYLGIANALFQHVDRISPMYRCVLIDESQDFGTVDIRLIRRLVPEGENDVFLCGDAAQQVSFKHQNLTEAGMAVPGARSHRLELNYRNSRQILEVAHGMLVDNLSDQVLQSRDFEVLDPKYANFGGPSPLLLEAVDQGQEFDAALTYARSEAEANPVAKICVAVCGYSEHELEAFACRVSLPILNGETKLEEGQVYLSDLENTKGFEFQCVIIVNCEAGAIPSPHAPREETFRDLSRLYVAMTRARQQLVVSYCGRPSEFLDKQLHRFAMHSWRDYLGGSIVLAGIHPPHRLDELRSGSRGKDIRDLTGEEYLYDEHAIGCPPILVEKLRSLITGHSRVVSGNPAEWKAIWQALKDTSANVRSRQVFGPEGYRLFRDRFGPKAELARAGGEELASGSMPRT